MRFDDRVTGNVRTYAPYARIVHVDIDPAEIGKNVAVEVPIVGDAKRVLRALTPMVEPRRRRPTRAEYLDQLAEWRASRRRRSWHGSGRLARRPAVRRLRRRADRRADRPRGDLRRRRRPEPDVAGPLRRASASRTAHVSSGGLGTMGFGVPAAMGAALGRPDRETWAITGDGGFQMTFQELMTLVQDRIPVKIALLDNKKLGMIRQWQEIIYAGNYHSAHLLGPRLPEARRRVRHPGVQGTDAGRGRRRDPRRAGRRRPGAGLVRDRRGAERLPDDAGRQGPVRPDREVGRGRRMSRRAGADRARARMPDCHAAPTPRPRAPPPRALPGGGETAPPRPGRDRPRQAGRPEPGRRA